MSKFEVGTRVTFPARQGDRDVTETGTVIPSWIGSRSRHWVVVELESGYRLEVRNDNLERVVCHGDGEQHCCCDGPCDLERAS